MIERVRKSRVVAPILGHTSSSPDLTIAEALGACERTIQSYLTQAPRTGSWPAVAMSVPEGLVSPRQ